jgi:hypothetical protein
MQPWTQFYATIGTAAAALLGLLFVVVSINVSVALGPEESVARPLTEQAFQNYLTVMLVAFLALFPGITTTTFGMVAFITSAASSVWVTVRFYQTLALQIRRRSWVYSLRRHGSSLIGFAILLASAFRMAPSWGTSYNWFAASTLILLFSATEASWGLLKRFAVHSS